MTDTEWGAPLTGAQMKALRDAGLPDDVRILNKVGILARGDTLNFRQEPYRLPAVHPAYTLLEAGWLDGRNVRLWFGGDKAPDDWVKYSEVLLRDGQGGAGLTWNHFDCKNDIIAYTAKDECGHVGYIVELPGIEGFQCSACGKVAGRREVDLARLGLSRSRAPRVEVTADAIDPSKVPPVQRIAPQPETVTIAKMTEAEWGLRINSYGMLLEDVKDIFTDLGLIKAEPTRAERFFSSLDEGAAYSREELRSTLIEKALNFERD